MNGIITEVTHASGRVDLDFEIEDSVCICRDPETDEVKLYADGEWIGLGFHSLSVSRRTKDGEKSCVELTKRGDELYVRDHGTAWGAKYFDSFNNEWSLPDHERVLVEGNSRVEVGYQIEVRLETGAASSDASRRIVRERAREFRRMVEGNPKSAAACIEVGTSLLRSMRDAPVDSSQYEAARTDLRDLVEGPENRSEKEAQLSQRIDQEGPDAVPPENLQHKITRVSTTIEDMYVDALE